MKLSTMKVLLVRLSSMGDLIHTLPAITDLSRYRPDIELHWLCEKSFADIARLHPFIKHIHMLEWRKWRTKLFQSDTWRALGSLKTDLRQAHYQQVVDSQGLIKSAVFAKWACAPIGGLDWHSAREPLASCFYANKFAVKKGEDAVWRNRQLFAQMFDYQADGAPDFGAVMPENASGSLKHLPEQYYVALHATSRDGKLWAFGHWLKFLNKLYESDGLPIMLPWGNLAEKQRAEQMADALPFVRVCAPLTLLQLADLLAKSRAVVGVDTGLLHLANAVNCPLVGIYTDSDPMKTGVQSSDWAKSVGGVGQMPSVNEVFDLLEICLKNKFQAD